MSRHFFLRDALPMSIIQPNAFLDNDDDDSDVKYILGENSDSNLGWRRYNPCPAHQFVVGDFGYVPQGLGIESFVKLGNILTDELATFSVEESTFGVQWGQLGRPFTLSHSSFIDGLAWLVSIILLMCKISNKYQAGRWLSTAILE